jgi:hypothetical protein
MCHSNKCTGGGLVQLFVVGTMYVLEEENEPHKGRLLLLRLSGSSNTRELKFLGETVVKRAVYQVCPIPNQRGRVAATVGHHVVVWNIHASGPSGNGTWRAFSEDCKEKVESFGLYLAIHGNTIAVGDLMKSVRVFKYFPEKHLLEHVASEYECAPSPSSSSNEENGALTHRCAPFTTGTLQHKSKVLKRAKNNIRGAKHRVTAIQKLLFLLLPPPPPTASPDASLWRHSILPST